MKKTFFAASLAAICLFSAGLTSCSESENNGTEQTEYANRTYGNEAVAACTELTQALGAAQSAIQGAKLTADQEAYLKALIAQTVDVTIVPTYRQLADACVEMRDALGNIDAANVSQSQVNAACTAFLKARKLWEQSEAFLGGAASDFDIDPHIDSWPLNRDLLHSYFRTGSYSDEALDDASILGFHALEFILFRNGQPRNASEFRANDTYKGFTDVRGADELKYAEAVMDDLVNHVYELEVAWDGGSNSSRLAAVQTADLEYQIQGRSYGDNMKNAGTAESTFTTIQRALNQLLAATEGSAAGISDEVGSKKIANPFTNGDISYVESPYSYNSITDFQDNIRSIENLWYGRGPLGANQGQRSFSEFFRQNSTAAGQRVEAAISDAINKIGRMPSPFVKYVSTIWNIQFEDAELKEYED